MIHHLGRKVFIETNIHSCWFLCRGMKLEKKTNCQKIGDLGFPSFSMTDASLIAIFSTCLGGDHRDHREELQDLPGWRVFSNKNSHL